MEEEIKLPPLPSGLELWNIGISAPDGVGKALQEYATEAIKADRKRQPRADTETLQQLNEVLQYLENEVMKLEAAYGHNFKPHATKEARATVEKLKAAMYTVNKRRGEPVDLDRYDAGLLGGQDGMPAYVWHDIIRAELDRAYDFYMVQLDRAAPQPAEPVKVPSEAKEALWKAYESLRELEKRIVLDANQISGAAAASFAANRVLALLTRYGATSQEQP